MGRVVTESESPTPSPQLLSGFSGAIAYRNPNLRHFHEISINPKNAVQIRYNSQDIIFDIP